MSDKPDRQTQAVAEAIFRVESGDKATWFGQPEYAKELYFEQAKAAIAASDAKYVPALMESLKRMSGYAQHDDDCTINDWHNTPECNCGYTEAWRSAQEILEKLPKDLR